MPICFPSARTAIAYRLTDDCRSDFEMCPRNVRVGANSPNLCPTMFSVTNTGMWRLPSCTAIVMPSISGIIVEARDQVRITTFDSVCCARVTFLASFGMHVGALLHGTGHNYRFLLSRAMNTSVCIRRRVFGPSAGLPHGVFGCVIPMPARPSPPPCG